MSVRRESKPRPWGCIALHYIALRCFLFPTVSACYPGLFLREPAWTQAKPSQAKPSRDDADDNINDDKRPGLKSTRRVNVGASRSKTHIQCNESLIDSRFFDSKESEREKVNWLMGADPPKWKPALRAFD